jgi:hypothetical protein
MRTQFHIRSICRFYSAGRNWRHDETWFC